MSVLTKEQVMEQVKTRIGDDTSDEALKFLEDLSDTVNDYESRANGDGTDWKAKYEENDKEWRTKYRERFFAPVENDEGNDSSHKGADDDDTEAPKTFDDLFKSK